MTRKTRLTRALAGALLLGGATSLPEITTTVTASALGNAPLAVNNLFGGVAMQLAVLAVVDLWFVRGALTYFSPKPVLLLGGVLLIVQTALAVASVAVGDYPLGGYIGVWPIVMTGVYVGTLYFMNRFSNRDSWIPAELPTEGEDGNRPAPAADDRKCVSNSLVQISLKFTVSCIFVLIGGWAVSSSADALSDQTGLSGGLVGATLVAVTTSLPEISTTAGAVRLGAYTMAISNIFGTNSLEVALLLPCDLAYRTGAVINDVDDSAVLMAAVAIVMTALYLWGLLERRNNTFCRMGIDSAQVLGTYAVGLALLYAMTA